MKLYSTFSCKTSPHLKMEHLSEIGKNSANVLFCVGLYITEH